MKLRNVITDEICDAEMREDGIYIKANWSDEEKWFCYDLETLARGWEYYVEPKEPLIETADARYITKLWASTNLIPSNSNEIEVCLIDSQKGTITQFYSDGIYIHFWGRVAPSAIDGRCYTIDELCGEEKE